MTWLDCPLIDRDEYGNYIVKGTTIWPEDIVKLREQGSLWIANAFKVPLSTVKAILDFQDNMHYNELIRRYG